MKTNHRSFLFFLSLIPSICFADTQSDMQKTGDLRKKILSHLQQETEYDQRDGYGRSVLNQVLPRIATSVVVCDGQLFLQDANKKSMPVQIYEESPLDIDAYFEDNSDSFTTADKLNGYQWKGGVFVRIKFDAYKPLTDSNWSSQGGVEYDYGVYSNNLVIRNGQLEKPEKNRYQDDESYNRLPYNKLVELNKYPPLTCESVDKSLKSYKTKENLSNGLNVILGIASIIQKSR